MIEAGTSKPTPFDVVIVHSFSRFFRDAFEMEFYVRKLAKNGVKLVSITQEMDDDPMHVMMRQIMAPLTNTSRRGFVATTSLGRSEDWRTASHAARMANCSARDGSGLKAYLACRLRIMWTISMPDRMMPAVRDDLKPSIGRIRRLIRR